MEAASVALAAGAVDPSAAVAEVACLRKRMKSLIWIVAAVFALALLGKTLRTFGKDPCLKFLDEFHVSLIDSKGKVHWGEMGLTSQGMQLHFDATGIDERGLSKCGVIVFPRELSEMVALCRSTHGITDAERELRDEQVRLVLEPTLWTRMKRALKNAFGMVRDAIIDSISLVFGQMGTSPHRTVAALAGGQRQVAEVGGAILDLGARAFEPLLERLVGKPVIARVGMPGDRNAYFPGYLAEYNEKYLVVVNPSHDPEESLRLTPGDERSPGIRVAFDKGCIDVEFVGDDSCVVKRVVGRNASIDIGATLLPGTKLSLRLPRGFDIDCVELDRTRRFDFVCPRSRSQVRFSSTRPPILRTSWSGSYADESRTQDA